MNIGIDVDSVLANLIDPTIKILNERYKKNFTRENNSYWDALTVLYNIPKKEILDVMENVWDNKDKETEFSDFVHTIKLEDKNAPKILKRLSKNHKISIITNRTKDSLKDVIEWLYEQDVYYDNFILNDGSLSKFSYPIDVLIDDSPKEIEKGVPENKLFFLYSQPWNKNIEITRKNIKRISSLLEIERYI